LIDRAGVDARDDDRAPAMRPPDDGSDEGSHELTMLC
jgi:hypothetical protein